MPFTFSHPAIVLPATLLPKRFYSLTGLVMGSMAPDFEYFIRMEGTSHYGHKISGIFWFDLLMGLFLAFLYHQVIRDSLIANLPKVLRIRVSSFSHFNWINYFKKNWPVVFISVIIGSASHLLWDGFTHEDGMFVNHLPFLQHHVKIVGSYLPIYNVCQHVSSIIGGLALILVIFNLPKKDEPTTVVNVNYWFSIFFISFLIMLYKVLSGLRFHSYHEPVIVAITSGLIALTITSYLFKLKADTR